MRSVFISYSHSDADVADEIVNALDDLAVSYFRDVKDIDWGDQITSSVRDGLENAAALIVIISPGSHKSQWVSYEVGYATALRKRILPYLTHPDLDPPGFMSDLAYVKTSAEVHKYFDANRDALLAPESPDAGTAFQQMVDLMPTLLSEMKEDVSAGENKYVREFVPLETRGIRFNHAKPRFEYYGDVQSDLQIMIDILENHGFVEVVHVATYSKIYRMTEEFVQLLRAWEPAA